MIAVVMMRTRWTVGVGWELASESASRFSQVLHSGRNRAGAGAKRRVASGARGSESQWRLFFLPFLAPGEYTGGARCGEAEQARLGKPKTRRGTVSRGDPGNVVGRECARHDE